MPRSTLLAILAVVLTCALLLPAPRVSARSFGGGGRGGAGNGSNGNGNGPGQGRGSNPLGPRQPDPKEQARQLQEKIETLLSNGFIALKASDPAAALEDFSDVLQLQPDQPLGHLGMGLVRAQKGKFTASEAEFSTAITSFRKAKADAKAKAVADAKAKALADAKAVSGPKADPSRPGVPPAFPAAPADPNAAANAAQAAADAAAELDANLRLANYDLAVAYSRTTDKGRALVQLDRMIGESKPPDEMLVNAQRSLIAALDEKSRANISALPALSATLETAHTLLRAAHAPLRRWGVTWMASEEVSRHRLANETEPLPTLLPFLMPDDELLPEPLQKLALATNPLAPLVAGQQAVAAAGKAGNGGNAADPTQPADATDKADKGDPAGAVASVGETPTGSLARGVPAAAPAVATGRAAPAPAARQAAPATRTVSGAAFAVSADLLVTCDRLAAGAKAIQVEAADGTAMKATLVASDEASGLALIQVEGARFTPLALADSPRAGVVTVPAFSKPSVFGPELETLRGDLSGQPGQMLLRTATHPRSAGSPVLDAQGKVVAVLTATRDDPFTRLPVASVEAVRKLAAGKFDPAAAAGADHSVHSVFEVTAMRED